MIGEIGNQVADIARTNGKIAATEAANEKMKTAGSDARNAAISQLKKDGKEVTDQAIHDQMYQTFYNEAFNQSGMGTGQSTQRAITAATAAIQALAGGDIKAAIAGGAAPYIANAIANAIPEKDLKGRVLAHAVVNAALAAASGRDAASAATGAAVGELAGKIAVDGFGKQVSELSEEEKQTVSALATLASGLAGGLVGDSSANAVAAAQAGKTTVENNFLSGDMYALDRKVKAAKEKGEDIEPILEDARKQSQKDRDKIKASCKANPDTCGFSRDAANDAQSEILENGPFLNIDPDVAKLVAQETAKDNAVISQNTSEFGKGLVVASEGLSIIAGMGTSAALNVLKTGGAIRDPKTGSTVTVYRVEGVPNTRVLIGEKGQVTITGETTLYLNFGDKARAQEFLQKRISQNMEGATIKTFEVPTSVLNDLRNSAVKENVARLPENKGKPVIADPTKADDQYGIRPEKLKDLQDKIIRGQEKMSISAEMERQILLERERLTFPPLPTQKATGVGIARFIVSCDSNAFFVLQLAKEVILIVNKHSLEAWPSLEYWNKILPSQFVSNCLAELTKQEKIEAQIRWEQLAYNEKIKEAAQDERWTLSSWLSWLEPEEREWFWWNAIQFEPPLENTHFVIEVTSLDSPFMSGSLKWLFKACGAVDVISEDDL